MCTIVDLTKRGDDMKRDLPFKNLRGVLASKGITQKELAELMTARGVVVKPASISHKINGLRDFNRNEMQIISEILEESPITLFFTSEYTICVPA